MRGDETGRKMHRASMRGHFSVKKSVPHRCAIRLTENNSGAKKPSRRYLWSMLFEYMLLHHHDLLALLHSAPQISILTILFALESNLTSLVLDPDLSKAIDLVISSFSPSLFRMYVTFTNTLPAAGWSTLGVVVITIDGHVLDVHVDAIYCVLDTYASI